MIILTPSAPTQFRAASSNVNKTSGTTTTATTTTGSGAGVSSSHAGHEAPTFPVPCYGSPSTEPRNTSPSSFHRCSVDSCTPHHTTPSPVQRRSSPTRSSPNATTSPDLLRPAPMTVHAAALSPSAVPMSPSESSLRIAYSELSDAAGRAATDTTDESADDEDSDVEIVSVLHVPRRSLRAKSALQRLEVGVAAAVRKAEDDGDTEAVI